MKKIVLALTLTVLAAAAQAQSADSSAGAAAGAQAGANSGSNSTGVVYINNQVPADQTIHNIQSGSVTSTQNINSVQSGSVDQNIHYSGSQTVRNVPGVIVSGPASGPCNGFSGGIGVAGPGFGVGVNTSTVDKGCTRRETIRVAALVGRQDIANALLESDPLVLEALQWQKDHAGTQPAQGSTPVPATPEAPKPVAAEAPKAIHVTDADLCTSARAKKDVALAERVCQ